MSAFQLRRALAPLLPRAVRPHRVLSGPIRGVRLVTSWHDYPGGITGRTEAQLIAWFAGHVTPGSTWLDVGAHYGYTAIALARLTGPAGRVFAFEPIQSTTACVRETMRLNGLQQVVVVPYGLASPETSTRIDLPAVRGMADGTIDRDAHPVETIDVARFDWLWPQINGGNALVDGVKIDVQGMEVEVVSGMAHLLARCRPKLVIELHRGVDRATLVDRLRASGYTKPPIPIDPARGESAPLLLDDRSYAFLPDR